MEKGKETKESNTKENEMDLNNIQKFKNMIKSRPKVSIMIGLILVLGMGIGSAAWYLSITDDATIEIRGGGDSDLVMNIALEDLRFMVNETDQITQQIGIWNYNGDFTAEFTANVTIENLNEACDPAGDLIWEYYDPSNNTLVTGGEVNITSGENYFTVNITSTSIRACDANYNLTLSWSEI